MARGTMASLITRTRLLIADPSGVSALFTDDQIQDKLDECRTDLWQALLTPWITFTNPGAMQYLDYYYIPGGNPRNRPVGFFEDGMTLIWGDFTTLTAATTDPVVGHWTFSPSQPPPVMIRGRYFDLYRASADLLDYKIASLSATQLDFTSDGQTFHLSQQLEFLAKMRDDYRRKQRAVSHTAARRDAANPVDGQPGVAPRQAGLVGPTSANVPFLTGE